MRLPCTDKLVIPRVNGAGMCPNCVLPNIDFLTWHLDYFP